VDINEYIKSGALEAYLSGSASETETHKLLYLKAVHPEIDDALYRMEVDLENLAKYMAIKPPTRVWDKIDDNLKELAKTEEDHPGMLKVHSKRIGTEEKQIPAKDGQFIEVEGSSTHMRIHKIWRWILLGIFILGKIFLGFAIYYYLENRQMMKQMEKQQQELSKKKQGQPEK
jgi:hypothetical protein